MPPRAFAFAFEQAFLNQIIQVTRRRLRNDCGQFSIFSVGDTPISFHMDNGISLAFAKVQSGQGLFCEPVAPDDGVMNVNVSVPTICNSSSLALADYRLSGDVFQVKR